MIRIEMLASVSHSADQIAAAAVALTALAAAAQEAGMTLHSLHIEEDDA